MDNRWQQIEELYHAAREEPLEQRANFLRLRCESDPALQREVESLLAHDADGQGALDYPAWDGMEDLLDDAIHADEPGDAPLAPGMAIGPYRITELLGAGGMGRVYRADDTRLGRVVAIKVSKARFSERFEREARAIAALNHPNICHLYDVGPNFLVMEFVGGAPVTGDCGIGATIAIAVQIAEGLAAAHAAGITHRDLKPDNILLTRSGQVKIVDFGLARVSGPGAVQSEPGWIMGTVEYMSPEQVRGEPVDHRSDIFSFGLIVYEMLAGRRAFAGGTSAETMTAILKQDTPELPESVPVLLRQIVLRCLEKDPANRFQSAKDLAFALARSHAGTAALPVKPARRFRTAGVAAAAAAVTAAVAALVFASRPEPLDTSAFRFTPVAADAKDTYHPAWSPDGRSLAYFERVGRIRWIVIRDLYRSTPPLHLVRVQNSESPLSWSPDGERVFYLEPSKGVLSISRAGGQPKVVLPSNAEANRTYSFAVLSPDGKTLAVLIEDRSQSGHRFRLAFSSPPGAEPKLVEDVLPPGAPSIAWASEGDRVLASVRSAAGADIFSLAMDGRQRPLQQFRGAGPFVVEFSAIPNSRFVVASRVPEYDAYGLSLLDGDSGEIRPLLPSQSPINSPSVSRDGSRIAYTSRSLFRQAYEIPIAGGAPRPLLPSSLTQYSVAFSPRADEFAITRLGQLLVHDRSSSAERVLVSSQDFPDSLYRPDLLYPAFSQAGDRIIFTCVGCEKDLSLWVVPAAGGTPARVIGDGNGGIVPSWSPDGTQIVYLRQTLDGQNEAVRLRLGSDTPERIGTDQCPPFWSPAGDWILCSGRKLKLISPDGSQARELVGTYSGAGWSIDGKLIYAARRAGDRVLIERVDPATGNIEKLTEYPTDGPQPQGRLSVSADGKSIAFTASAGDSDIWILDGFKPPRTLWKRLWPWQH
ncbi:MAG: serine/threonine-protein kinase [Bryobacterales bacterium]|nr:serine/threonine-protein kinase [Bryobacterales bacterium]